MGRLIVSSRCRMCRCKLELSVDNGLFVQISVFAQTVQSSSGVGLLRCLERLSHGGAIFTCARVGVRVTVARDKNLHLHVGSGEIFPAVPTCVGNTATLQCDVKHSASHASASVGMAHLFVECSARIRLQCWTAACGNGCGIHNTQCCNTLQQINNTTS